MSTTRYESRIKDGVFYVQSDNSWLEVGSVDNIVELLGGETYTLEYTNMEASAAWLKTTKDNTIEVNIRDVLKSMSYQGDFVTNLKNCPLNEDSTTEHPKRTELYASLMIEILDSKGNLEN
ncbi:hypothetical protein [Halococcus sp. IIIV-5B]|uniref:hypothetical protein n=1 Tax=Halococcus sp. IIIV-5B TaxID=2321230 RepID=UPI000E75B694|nr:hypothetical protein [Halococcus sp. IIIV-5B]RJT07175.1 hypothetical protein D3261_04005 [Halococcus sp. IIIV-5B]